MLLFFSVLIRKYWRILKTSSFSLAYSSYSLTIASFKMIAHSSRSSALCLHLLTPNVFRSSSAQSSYLNLGLPDFLLPPVFPETLSSPSFHHPFSQYGQLIPTYFYGCDYISTSIYRSCNSLFVQILHPSVSLLGLYTFLKILLSQPPPTFRHSPSLTTTHDYWPDYCTILKTAWNKTSPPSSSLILIHFTYHLVLQLTLVST
jgi:hypothetical protein